jgi:hypothetical protein
VVPLFEISAHSLEPLRQVLGGPELYEKEIEGLVWSDPEAITGEPLFLVARRRKVANRGIPDIAALDKLGRVVVIEVKRDLDRGQLAQALEYAGWARSTSLDELAGIYDRGHDEFFSDWATYTETDVPQRVSRSPRVVLVARDFHERTRAALDFLAEAGVPVLILPVAIYERGDGKRFVHVDAEHQPEVASGGEVNLLDISTTDAEQQGPISSGKRRSPLYHGRRPRLTDLLEAGLIEANEPIELTRKKLRPTCQRYRARERFDQTRRWNYVDDPFKCCASGCWGWVARWMDLLASEATRCVPEFSPCSPT